MNPEPGSLTGDLLASVSRSFYLSIKALPAEIRAPIALGYLLARASDTIADTTLAPVPVRLAGLEAFCKMMETGKAEPLPPEIAPENPSERELLARLPECFARL